ncbi:hypothetical protein PFISCL1PPCAC_4588, partial [Pristionchus fissidentatus]
PDTTLFAVRIESSIRDTHTVSLSIISSSILGCRGAGLLATTSALLLQYVVGRRSTRGCCGTRDGAVRGGALCGLGGLLLGRGGRWCRNCGSSRGQGVDTVHRGFGETRLLRSCSCIMIVVHRNR